MTPRPPTALGWLLLVPALLGALVSLLVPTVQTIVMSLQNRRGIGRDAEFVGLDNYVRLFGEGGFWRALAFSVTLAVLPLLVAVVVAPLLALALERGGTRVRQAGRVVTSLFLVVFSPVAIAVAWRQGPRTGGIAGLLEPPVGPAGLTLIVAAATFGVVCGLGLLAYLPALRGGTAVPATLAVGGVVGLAALAMGLQAFTFSYLITGGSPGLGTETLATQAFKRTFQFFRFGLGAASSTVTGLILAVLGVAATVIVVVTRMRIALVPRQEPRTSGMAVLGVLALIVFAGLALLGSWPWVAALFTGTPVQGVSATTYVNTWLPPILGAVVSVGTAYLAALGIGALRPLGRASEWLLLPFAPWLFVGIGPLSLAIWDDERELGLLNSFVSLIPPVLVSVPALVVLTLFLRGQFLQGGPFLRSVVLPSLPMAALLTGGVALVNAQDYFWPMLVITEADKATAPALLVLSDSGYSGGAASVGITTPIVVVVLALAALVAAQLTFLDRLTLEIGSPSPESGA